MAKLSATLGSNDATLSELIPYVLLCHRNLKRQLDELSSTTAEHRLTTLVVEKIELRLLFKSAKNKHYYLLSDRTAQATVYEVATALDPRFKGFWSGEEFGDLFHSVDDWATAARMMERTLLGIESSGRYHRPETTPTPSVPSLEDNTHKLSLAEQAALVQPGARRARRVTRDGLGATSDRYIFSSQHVHVQLTAVLDKESLDRNFRNMFP